MFAYNRVTSGRLCSTPSHKAHVHRLNGVASPLQRGRLHKAAAYNNNGAGDEMSKSVLEAFYLGRAFAEAVNDRLGAALGDLLSEVGQRGAEMQHALKEFMEEVEARAQTEMVQSTATSYSSSSSSTSSTSYAPSKGSAPSSSLSANGSRLLIIAQAPDLQESVDDLRAEVASTRAAVQQFKAARTTQMPSQPL